MIGDINLTNNKCWLCRICRCESNTCCFFNAFKQKRRTRRIKLVSRHDVCLCDQHYSEFERIKFLLDLLLHENAHPEESLTYEHN